MIKTDAARIRRGDDLLLKPLIPDAKWARGFPRLGGDVLSELSNHTSLLESDRLSGIEIVEISSLHIKILQKHLA
jgi:hypothetical protein